MVKYNYVKINWFGAIGWIILFGLFYSIVNYFRPPLIALYTAITDTLVLFIIYQITVLIIFPRFFKNKKQYLLVALFVILSFSWLYYIIDIKLFPKIHETAHKPPPEIFHYLRMVMFTSLVFFIGTSLSLINHNNRLIENEKILTEEKLSTELKLLKAQINPHFIFNALNNIYSLTYTKAQNAPDAVLKLSEMLRYVFYDCGKEHVKLSSEIKYIENFIGFQQMKSDFVQNIKLSASVKSGSEEIAPMLFIPFIENAFKYSRIEENEDEYVEINISSSKDKVVFKIVNGFDEHNKPPSGNGMGITNVKHRLKILYPEKHDLKISETENEFKVELSIFV